MCLPRARAAALLAPFVAALTLASTVEELVCSALASEDACVAESGEQCALSLLQTRIRKSRNGLPGAGAAPASPEPPDVLDLVAVKAAFASRSGLTLRVADPGKRADIWPASTTVWRDDLPLALFSLPRSSPSDTAGIIFKPDHVRVLCGYAVDANTIVRTAPDNSSRRDSCGVLGPKYAFIGVGNLSGRCDFATPQDFASAYFYKPMVSLRPGYFPPLWALEYNVCSFEDAPSTLDAQRALLEAMLHQPRGMSPEEALVNATRLGSGITAFNEVVVAPYTAAAAVVGGIFWAHPGGFREPRAGEAGACAIAKHLAGQGDRALPVFELAGVNLERPFLGCHVAFEEPAADCLTRGLGEWRRNLTAGGGRDASLVFRDVSAGTFRELLDNGGCDPSTNSAS